MKMELSNQGNNEAKVFADNIKDIVFSLHMWRAVLESNFVALMHRIDQFEIYKYKEEYPDPIIDHVATETFYVYLMNYLTSVAGIKQTSYALKNKMSDDVFNEKYDELVDQLPQVVDFIDKLRNSTAHRALPYITKQKSQVLGQNAGWLHRVLWKTGEIKSLTNWSEPNQEYIKQKDDNGFIHLKPIFEMHYQNVFELAKKIYSLSQERLKVLTGFTVQIQY